MIITKRNGSTENFKAEKIAIAITKALKEVGAEYKEDYPLNFAHRIEEKFYLSGEEEIAIETLQDMIEVYLMTDQPKAAKAYILYRNERKNKWKGWKNMGELQKDIYESKYRYNKEDFQGFLERVAKNNRPIQKAILEKKFVPAGRILAGRGLNEDGRKVSLSNCYALPSPEDHLEDIFDTAKEMARTYSYGGGVGINISKLRPAGSAVNNAARTTSGPTSFMSLFASTTEIIGMQGRRGALMLMMESRHPDIEKFITIKNDLDEVLSANISVAIDDGLMEAAKNDENYLLSFTVEATGEVIEKKVRAMTLLRSIASSSWDMAEPGVLFWDTINDWHLMSKADNFEFASPNPCAEQMLPAYGACCLSAINLGEFILDPFTKNARIDMDGLREMVRNGVIYLNEILDEGMPFHPLKGQIDVARKYRQIGMGIMGVADLFIKMGLRYGEPMSIDFLDSIMNFIKEEAILESIELAIENGPAPAMMDMNFESSFIKSLKPEIQEKIKEHGLRNTQILTIAPTGSTATLIEASTGIEPLFQVSYNRRTLSINDGQETEYKVYSKVVKDLMETQGITDEKDLPDYVVTSHDLSVEERIAVQAVAQKHIDAAISSTINMPKSATVQDIVDAIFLAHESGLKGVTFYRDGCRRGGILTTDKKEKQDDSHMCPDCNIEMDVRGGCEECPKCGYSPCSI